MADKSLSTRQKMIGLMYLVLTAMLALQVSNSVMDKFMLLSWSIDRSTSAQVKQNKVIVRRVQDLVAEMSNRDKDIAILDQVVSMREYSEKVIHAINKLQNELIQSEGGVDKVTKLPKGLMSEGAVSEVMLYRGEANELKKTLDDYVVYASNIRGSPYPKIAFDAKEHYAFKDNPNQIHKDFATLNFDHTPLGTALATLSQFAAEVVRVETGVLKNLRNRVNAGDIKFDVLQPLVSPKSNIVAAGAKYEADLFLTASSSAVAPTMFVDDKKIPVENGVGKIAFTTSPGNYDANGLAKKKLKTAIQLKMPNGKDSTFVKEVNYLVARPVIQVRAAAVQALYNRCGNELNIQVPTLGASYNPRFTITGGEIIKGKSRGMITVIPNGEEVKLNVYNGDSFIGQEVFKVKGIPLPEIQITSKGKVVNQKMGVPAPGPRKIEVKVILDESFAAFLPKDARYRVVSCEVTLARGNRPIRVRQVADPVILLHKFAKDARPGDRFVIEVKK